mmetsp:Transcript_6345/g.18140  ORF Transcript_6345/g.18140 Transcript_6345/m.18140 type:complete len:289 (-) Transcript_6345:1445-2311(-)
MPLRLRPWGRELGRAVESVKEGLLLPHDGAGLRSGSPVPMRCRVRDISRRLARRAARLVLQRERRGLPQGGRGVRLLRRLRLLADDMERCEAELVLRPGRSGLHGSADHRSQLRLLPRHYAVEAHMERREEEVLLCARRRRLPNGLPQWSGFNDQYDNRGFSWLWPRGVRYEPGGLADDVGQREEGLVLSASRQGLCRRTTAVLRFLRMPSRVGPETWHEFLRRSEVRPGKGFAGLLCTVSTEADDTHWRPVLLVYMPARLLPQGERGPSALRRISMRCRLRHPHVLQ